MARGGALHRTPRCCRHPALVRICGQDCHDFWCRLAVIHSSVRDTPTMMRHCPIISRVVRQPRGKDSGSAANSLVAVSESNSLGFSLPRPWFKSEPVGFGVKLQGHDATHRTRNLDTHLTHGCIQLFRHFSSGGSDAASNILPINGGISPLLETSHRHLGRASR